MKKQVAALVPAMGMYVVALLPFGLAYFLMAASMLWGHGSSHTMGRWLSTVWLGLAIVVPLWVAVISYRRMLGAEPSAESAS